MAVTLPREGRYSPGVSRHDWAEARRRLEAEPNEWVLPVDDEVSNGSVSWLRARGPRVLSDIRREVEYRLRETHTADGANTVVGTLYARYTPGQAAPPYVRVSLNDEQVREIREAYANGGVTQIVLADKYEVSNSTINAIVRGVTHRDAGGPVTTA
jgi:hypothetical protein